MAKLIGTAPNQVPTNADLGTMAYLDYAPVVFQVEKTDNQALPAGTHTLVTFTTVRFDTHSGWDASNNRYIVSQTGIYNVGAKLRFGAIGDRRKIFGIWKNGGQIVRLVEASANWTGGDLQLGGHMLVSCSIGDYLQIYAWTSTTGDTIDYGDYSYFEVNLVAGGIK